MISVLEQRERAAHYGDGDKAISIISCRSDGPYLSMYDLQYVVIFD
jgi:hypothetical protein